MRAGWGLGVLLLVAALGAGLGSPACQGRQEARGAPVRALPAPRTTGRVSLEQSLALRRSVREFAPRPLTWDELGQLAWACQGRTDPRGFRTAPSAGALYPLELYLATEEALFQYLPDSHALERRAEGDLRPALCEAALGQEPVGSAPAVFILAGVQERTAAKYGSQRSPRYVHMEAGHAAQNLLLQAVALDLGAVPVGAFDDDRVAKVLGLSRLERPLYLLPVGHPRAGDG